MGIQDENNQECLVMGKGVAFGKKVGQTVPVTAEAKVYSLKEMTERGEAKDILKSVSPLCLEFANEVLNQAEQEFGKVDRTILFTMADHLDFAIRRIQNGEQISNPLTDDIRVMFYKEYKVASCIQELLKEKLQLEIDEHEIGYIALHVHAAICFPGNGDCQNSPRMYFSCRERNRKFYRRHVTRIQSSDESCALYGSTCNPW